MKIKIKLPNHRNADVKLEASHVILAARTLAETHTAVIAQGRSSESMLCEDLKHLLQSLYKNHKSAVLDAIETLATVDAESEDDEDGEPW